MINRQANQCPCDAIVQRGARVGPAQSVAGEATRDGQGHRNLMLKRASRQERARGGSVGADPSVMPTNASRRGCGAVHAVKQCSV